MENWAIGIDLGTTYTCLACFHGNRVEIIPNKNSSHRTTPSIVSFTSQNHVVGGKIKVSNLKNTVYEAKRLIGRTFKDIENDAMKWPYKVVEEASFPKIEIEYKNSIQRFSPEEISAMVLKEMKDMASKHLGQNITKAVITVPAYFNDAQREATNIAAKIAGLEVLRIINEPTAAAIAYGYDNHFDITKNILIFDLGGGTFDVSIVQIDKGRFKILAVGGDTRLGGVDFNNNMVQYLVGLVKDKYNIDISNDAKIKFNLHKECEDAKLFLSQGYETNIEIKIGEEEHYENITRALFEKINKSLFEKTIEIVKNTIKDAKLSKYDIADVVLVGGSSKIPKIQNLLKEFFKDREIKQNINDDEAVAYGAAIQAAILNDTWISNSKIYQINISDVTPLSLGIEIRGGLMSNIIDRNTNIPCEKIRHFSNPDSNTIRITIFQGEAEEIIHNHLLGEFVLKNLTPSKIAGNLEVTFFIDADGILNVKACDLSDPEKREKIQIEREKRFLSETQIKLMIRNAESINSNHHEQIEMRKVKNDLEEKCNQILYSLETSKFDETKKNDIKEKTEETIKKLRSNTNEWSLEEMLIELEKVQSILSK